MSDTENVQLRNEITRLNGIIDVLLLQNRMHLQEIASLKTGNSPPGADSSTINFNKGRTDAGNSFANFQKRSPDKDNSLANFEKGRSGVYSSLPDFVEATPAVISRLSVSLKAAGMPKVRRSGVRNMALIILQAHNKQSCSHADLRKLTGLSEGGMAKLMMSMKKRGLIYREGFKRFGISASSRQMLAEACAVLQA